MTPCNVALLAAEAQAKANADLNMSRGGSYEGVGHILLPHYIVGVDLSLDGISYWFIKAGEQGLLHGTFATRDDVLAFIETHQPDLVGV